MKIVMSALLMMTSPALAQSSSSDLEIVYLSWCEKNSVMAAQENGAVYEKANCSEQGLVCKTQQSRKGMRALLSAVCTEK
ncbi:MAG: hypothetical protein AAGB31_06660 [Bdellovibrio sp.]